MDEVIPKLRQHDRWVPVEVSQHQLDQEVSAVGFAEDSVVEIVVASEVVEGSAAVIAADSAEDVVVLATKAVEVSVEVEVGMEEVLPTAGMGLHRPTLHLDPADAVEALAVGTLALLTAV